MGLWLENRLMKLGYKKFLCDWCSAKVWMLGFIVGYVDNTDNGFCPSCSNYVDF